MPELTLQVISLDGSPPQRAMLCVFGDAGGSLGRDEGSTFSLPDKHRRVSRLHATIAFDNGLPTITNSSSSLPIALGEQQIDCGTTVTIPDGALIEIGPYVLRARLAGSQATTVVTPPASNVPSLSVPSAAASLGSSLGRLPASTAPASPQSNILGAPVVSNQGNGLDLESLFPANPSGAGSDPFGLSGTPTASTPLWSEPASTPPSAAQVPPTPPPSIHASPVIPEGHSFGGVAGNAASSPITSDDPFAGLLDGIGAPQAVPPVETFGLPTAARPSPTPPIQSTGISADPLAAFGGAPTPSTDSFSSRPTHGTTPSGGRIPDDFNPFALPSDAGRNAADPLAALLGGGTPSAGSVTGAGAGVTPSIDSLFSEAQTPGPSFGGGSSPSLLGGLGSFGETQNGLDRLIRSDPAGNDPLAMLDAANAFSPALERPMRDDSAEMGSAFQPPKPIIPVAAPVQVQASTIPANPFIPSSPPKTESAAPQSSDSLTEAFLKGAGLPASALPQGLTPEIMAMVGSLLRSATAGAVDMLAARAATKREVQANVTIISVQANNPLKFLPNADAALLQLLGKKMPGFMRADVAMRDAFDDLRAHEVGVIAGTRAALNEVLGKFDPAVLGEKLAKGSVLESLMPSARKAKLWDMYLERYLLIRREAEDDFQSIFGKAFVLAYERETARIKGDSSGSGGERQ